MTAKNWLLDFGIKLDELMRKHGVTNEKLAEIVGCSTQMISYYRTSRNFPQPEKICAIADYFDVSLDYLFGRKRNMLLSEFLDIKHMERKLGASVVMEYTQVSDKSVLSMRFSINDVISKPSIYPRQDPDHVSIVNSLNLLGSTRNETIDSYYAVNGNIYRIPPNSDIEKEVSQESAYLQYEHIDVSVYKYVIEGNSLDPFREIYLKERRRLGIIGRLSPNEFYMLNFLLGYYEAEIKSQM